MAGPNVLVAVLVVLSATPEAPKPATPEVDIATLEQRYVWKAGEWQDQLLKAADAASGKANGKTSRVEMDQYLTNPGDLKFITSAAMQRVRNELKTAGGTKAASAFSTPWGQEIGRRADSLGNKDKKLTDAELSSYLDAIKAGSGKDLPVWLPDQKRAATDSKLALVTGEPNSFAVIEGSDAAIRAKGPLLSKEYMLIQMDEHDRIPEWVSYQLTAADIAERPSNVDRKGDKSSSNANYRKADPFHADPEWKASPSDKAYAGTKDAPAKFDQGHMKNALDSPNMEAMYESFLMSNMSTQYKALNEQSWATLEGAVHELVTATGGEATIVTGNLFLDDKGQPLPSDKRQYMKPIDGEAPIAVPSDCFKVVLLTLPDGKQQMLAYTMSNREDLPRKADQFVPMLRKNRTSVSAIDKALGKSGLFGMSGIPRERLDALKADATSPVVVPDIGKYPKAKMLWGDWSPKGSR
jgi:endonuclease G